MRAALGRYEAAYSALDAAAAADVYPSIDRRQLERAFEDLTSQRVALGDCRIRMADSVAQADCAGSARWTQRVGGGTQTAPRRWTFDLRHRNGEWVIERARVQ